MAQEEKISFDCRVRLTVGLAASAAVTGAAFWAMWTSGLNFALAAVITLVIGAALLWAVDHVCRGWETHFPTAGPGSGGHGPDARAARAAAPDIPDPGANPGAAEAAKETDARIAGALDRGAAEIGGAAAEKRPPALDAPRGGQGDDLKQLRGVGPKLEETLRAHGVWHFDQIAAWTDEEVAWVDAHLEGARGRASRDDWVGQAKALAETGPGAAAP